MGPENTVRSPQTWAKNANLSSYRFCKVWLNYCLFVCFLSDLTSHWVSGAQRENDGIAYYRKTNKTKLYMQNFQHYFAGIHQVVLTKIKESGGCLGHTAKPNWSSLVAAEYCFSRLQMTPFSGMEKTLLYCYKWEIIVFCGAQIWNQICPESNSLSV